jgi:hypothetical protein
LATSASKAAASKTAASKTDWPPGPQRGATWALWGGILFSVLYTAAIYALGARLEAIPKLPDAGASWYYWKLPEPTFWGRASAWGLYLAHQVSIWGVIWWAQTRGLRYTRGLHRVNLVALGLNAAFVLLHLLQTHLFYDGLAQDVSIWSSQASVIVLLVWILLMENSRRGMFFGKKMPISQRVTAFARKYHGYFFAWAIIYTFWYHPAEATVGHLWGFFYTLLLLVQSSLIYTRAHVNRYWTFALELTVLIHGTLVAVMQGNGIWPMFFFGFGGVFVITQMHGLGLSRLARAGLLGLYVAAVLYVYNARGWDKLNEIVRIPLIDYLAVVVLALILGGGLWVARRVRGAQGAV